MESDKKLETTDVLFCELVKSIKDKQNVKGT